MAQISVVQFASELGLPPALLLEQLQAAGVKRELGEETVLTETDKAQLLEVIATRRRLASGLALATLLRECLKRRVGRSPE